MKSAWESRNRNERLSLFDCVSVQVTFTIYHIVSRLLLGSVCSIKGHFT